MAGYFALLSMVLSFLPMIAQLIAQAETLFTGSGKGADKKVFVMSALKVVITMLGTVSTGGQLATWERIAPHLEPIIDSLASIIFPSDVKTGTLGAAPVQRARDYTQPLG